MSETSTKPYFMRAIYEWCTDNGFTPYIAVKVNGAARVPMEFVRNGEIVLNISFGATASLKMDNEAVTFKARFGGVSRDIYVPVANVAAIYASENSQGMAFEVDLQENLVEQAPQNAPISGEEPGEIDAHFPAQSSEKNAPESQKTSKKPFLKLIK
jgi:stringent starvation protein B